MRRKEAGGEVRGRVGELAQSAKSGYVVKSEWRLHCQFPRI